MIKIDDNYSIEEGLLTHTPCKGYIWRVKSLSHLLKRKKYTNLVKWGGYLDCFECKKITPLEVINKVIFITS